jgi:lipid kinase YegS
MLHQPVLPGVIGDHRDDSARLEPIAQRRECALERIEFVVDCNANGLKESGEVTRPGTRPECPAYGANKVVARGEGLTRATPDDLRGQSTRPRLVAIAPEDILECSLRLLVEERSRVRTRVVAHAHVERSAFPIGESARRIVELSGGNTEVKQYSLEPAAGQHVRPFEVGVVQLVKLEATRVHCRLQALRCKLQRGWVAVEGGHVGTGVEQCCGVAATAQGTIEHAACPMQQPEDFSGQHRGVILTAPPLDLVRHSGHTNHTVSPSNESPPRPSRNSADRPGERRRVSGARTGARSEPQHLVLIVHGSRAEHTGLRKAVMRLRGRGHRIDVRVTWEPGDGTLYARDAVAEMPRAIVAVGGDGTVNEVLNGIAGTDVALGIVPLGTANDFARQARISDNPESALGTILRKDAVRIDAASLNERRFLNVSTGGIGALVTASVSKDTKARLGPLAYALSSLRHLARSRSFRGRFVSPGLEYDGAFSFFAVGNARRTGGGRAITPGASVTDGLLDVLIVEALPRMELARVGLALRRGAHVDSPGVHYAQVPELSLRAERPVPVNVDGEFAQLVNLDYRSHRLDVRVFLPRVPDIWKVR